MRSSGTTCDSVTELFEAWRQRIAKLRDEHPLQIISWEATRRCNLRCRHCGSPSEDVDLSEELTANEVIDAFEQIAHDFDMSGFRHINITGGEPFVRADLLQILKAINKHPFYRNIDIQTNGVFIADHPEVLDKLKSVGVTGLGVSIDGLRNSHDSLRNMHGCWEKAVQAAVLAVEAGYVVTVSFVAHAKNICDLRSFYEFVRQQIKPRVFRVMLIDALGRAAKNGDYLLSPVQTREVIDFLKQEYKATCSQYANPRSTMVELGCGGWLGTELEGRIRPFIFHCIAGLNNLGILFDGKLGSCSNISREFIEGDLRKDRIRAIWEKRYHYYRDVDWKKHGRCATCDQWEYCHGGPMHRMSRDGCVSPCLLQLCRERLECYQQ
jgi:radical SAM protein with 4Fe4S-binding SPASM domain